MGTSLREDAEELAIGLEQGFANIDEVVEWADAHICAMDAPPYELIEVSMYGRQPRPTEVAHLLRAIPGDADVGLAARRVVRRMATALENGRASPDAIAAALYQMYLNGHVPDRSAEGPMACLDDYFSLARQGVYALEDILADLRAFLKAYY